ncbi:MAG TPA: nucleotidyltransferase domain-containing protein [Spirochaetales bacterium]|nr:nucleotidyltransferase domain-containing protein [Spirochaetales bacterium]HOV37549.1 nucleotidyltransferase domain-containing protein [Spirochaetales bacterium]
MKLSDGYSTGTFDPSPYRDGWKKRSREVQKRIEERFARVQEFLPELIRSFLAIDPELQKIILFGSLARGMPKREDFDIDIGVRSDRYFALVGWALRQEWKIDVVDLDSISESFLEDIESKGVVLYEKN